MLKLRVRSKSSLFKLFLKEINLLLLLQKRMLRPKRLHQLRRLQ
jgi:hypothetical protein